MSLKSTTGKLTLSARSRAALLKVVYSLPCFLQRLQRLYAGRQVQNNCVTVKPVLERCSPAHITFKHDTFCLCLAWVEVPGPRFELLTLFEFLASGHSPGFRGWAWPRFKTVNLTTQGAALPTCMRPPSASDSRSCVVVRRACRVLFSRFARFTAAACRSVGRAGINRCSLHEVGSTVSGDAPASTVALQSHSWVALIQSSKTKSNHPSAQALQLAAAPICCGLPRPAAHRSGTCSCVKCRRRIGVQAAGAEAGGAAVGAAWRQAVTGAHLTAVLRDAICPLASRVCRCKLLAE